MKIIIYLFFITILIFSCSNSQKVETPFVPQDIFEQNDTISNKDDDSPIIITNKKEKYTTFERSKELSLENLEIEPYTFRDTILSGGYHLSYRVTKDTGDLGFIQSLTLVKGKQDIKMLGLTSYPMRKKELGLYWC